LWREHRGDSHNLALAAADVDGVQAHILMAARGHGTKATILPLRGWTPEAWDEGVARLVERGWLHPNGTFTAQGRVAKKLMRPRTRSTSAAHQAARDTAMGLHVPCLG
jgi:hypothetical protein